MSGQLFSEDDCSQNNEIDGASSQHGSDSHDGNLPRSFHDTSTHITPTFKPQKHKNYHGSKSKLDNHNNDAIDVDDTDDDHRSTPLSQRSAHSQLARNGGGNRMDKEFQASTVAHHHQCQVVERKENLRSLLGALSQGSHRLQIESDKIDPVLLLSPGDSLTSEGEKTSQSNHSNISQDLKQPVSKSNIKTKAFNGSKADKSPSNLQNNLENALDSLTSFQYTRKKEKRKDVTNAANDNATADLWQSKREEDRMPVRQREVDRLYEQRQTDLQGEKPCSADSELDHSDDELLNLLENDSM